MSVSDHELGSYPKVKKIIEEIIDSPVPEGQTVGTFLMEHVAHKVEATLQASDEMAAYRQAIAAKTQVKRQDHIAAALQKFRAGLDTCATNPERGEYLGAALTALHQLIREQPTLVSNMAFIRADRSAGRNVA